MSDELCQISRHLPRRAREVAMKIALRSFSQLRSQPVLEKRGEPLHKRMGIETHVHRQAILDDPRLGRRYDWTERVWNHQHRYRENVTLAGN
jgi:hypothetical protein